MFKMRWILETILLIYLAAATVQDIQSKRVALRPALVIAALGVLLHLGLAAAANPSDSGTLPNVLLSCLAGTLPGIFLLTVGWATGQEVGYGDGIVLLVIGIYLGFSAGISIFLTALLLITPVSLFYIACKKAGRRKKLPFIPFLLAGYLLWLATDIF